MNIKLLPSVYLILITLTACSQKSEADFMYHNPFFVYVGKGSLMTKDMKSYYRTAQLKTNQRIIDVLNTLQSICLEENSCVGFQYRFGKNGTAPEAALLYDAKKVSWPYEIPDKWTKYGIQKNGHSETTADCKTDLWCGTGMPSLSGTSVHVNKDWENWECWAKVSSVKNNTGSTPKFDWSQHYRLTTRFTGEGKSLGLVKSGDSYKIRMVTTRDSPEQYWKIIEDIGGYYHLQPMLKEGHRLVTTNQRNERLQLAVVSTADVQKLWQIEKSTDGYFRLMPLSEGHGKSLDIINDDKDNKLVPGNTGNYSGQHWKITKIRK